MKKLSVVLWLLLAAAVQAQKNTSTDPTPFANSITAADLKKHLYTIAGPEFEGRGTATDGIHKAATYIEKHFRGLKLQPGNKDSYQQHYPIQSDSLVSARLSINGQTYTLYQDYLPSTRGNSNGTISGNEVVFAGFGISDPAYDDYKNINIKGKMVLVMEGEPKLNDTAYLLTGNRRRSEWNGTAKKIQYAAKNGAAALLIINKNFPRKVPSTSRGSMYVNFTQEEPLNVWFISEKLGETILKTDAYKQAIASVNAGKPASASYLAETELEFTKYNFGLSSSNVMAFLPGTDKKDELLIITAHYDHLGKRDSTIYYGADDDGSGTVGVLEIAEAFAKARNAGKGPRRSILFMTVSGEEMGLWGSQYYTTNPVHPLEKTTADLNIDMIGRVGSDYRKDNPDSLNYIYVIGDDKLSSDLRPVSESMNNKYTNLKLDYRYNDPKDPNRFYYRSDHYNFAAKGVPIIFYFNGVHNDYHRPTDTPEKINYELMAKRAQLVFYTAWEMANREEMIKRDIPLK